MGSAPWTHFGLLLGRFREPPFKDSEAVPGHGQAKILDFGLAKLVPQLGVGAIHQSPLQTRVVRRTALRFVNCSSLIFGTFALSPPTATAAPTGSASELELSGHDPSGDELAVGFFPEREDSVAYFKVL